MKRDQSNKIGFYVVSLNQLIAELNKVTRVTFNPNTEEIIRIAKTIEANAELIRKEIKNERAN